MKIEQRFIPLMIPNLTDEDIQSVSDVLKSGMLVQGDRVESFENKIAEYVGVRHAIAVSNGTASLHLALIALGVGSGDEVIVPALSYIATANVVELVGAIPIFVDVDLKTFNIDVSQIENAITKKTKAIIPVHEFGLVADMFEINNIAKKYRLFVIEDAACALGAKYQSKSAGSFGDVGSFSFHPRKAITSGEGGLLVTNDDSLARKLRALRNHGIEIRNRKMEFVLAGFNYRMTDFQAALLNSQLNRFDSILMRKTILASEYDKKIDNSKISAPVVPKEKKHSWQTYHVMLEDGVNRNEVMLALRKMNIGTNYGAQCMPNELFYKNKYHLNSELLFPNAMNINSQGLALPLYEKLTMEQINYISKTLNNTI